MLPLRVLCLALVLAGVAWGVRGNLERHAAADVKHPNILLISIDSLRADHVGSYGYARDTTPNIDRLARSGVLFASSMAAAPWTVPSHMTMLTALPPEVHGVRAHTRALRDEAVTLAEVLQQAGYDTAGFVSGPTVMAHYGFGQGFSLFDESMVEPNRAASHSGVTSPGLVEIVDGYLERWDYSGRREPFFVFLHMWDVHYDYAPPPPYDTLFDPDYKGDITSEDFERNKRINANMDPRDLQHLIALYDGEIRFTDEHLGKVIAQLERLHALDDTIVVVTSDHGDEFFEHGLKGHAKTLYDEVLHVPLIIRYPSRLRFGERVPEQVRMMDLAPTILGLAGVVPPPEFGNDKMPKPYCFADLSPFIAGLSPRTPFPILPAFSETGSVLGHQSAVRTAAAKLIRYDTPRKGKIPLEVFDLADDPKEQKNLIGSGDAGPLKQQLDPEMTLWRAYTGALPQLAEARRPTPQHAARLRALGYIQ